MEGAGLYGDQYAAFWKGRDEASGYDFGQAPRGNVPPPMVRFTKPLRWWTWGRLRRVHALLRFRDQRQEKILRLGTSFRPATGPVPGPVQFSNNWSSIRSSISV
jgi:hypothetical protein